MKVTIRSTSPDMTTIFHASPYSSIIDIKGNLRRKKFHRMNQVSNFVRDIFSNRDNVRVSNQAYKRKTFLAS